MDDEAHVRLVDPHPERVGRDHGAHLAGQGRTGGATQANRFGPQCAGMIDSTPDHTIKVTSALDLQLSVDSTTDSTLVVVGPAGVFCDDDSGGQLDAAVVDSFRPGEYEIYVGQLGQAGEYRLEISETR